MPKIDSFLLAGKDKHKNPPLRQQIFDESHLKGLSLRPNVG